MRSNPACHATWAGLNVSKEEQLRAAAWGRRAALRRRMQNCYPSNGTVTTTAKPLANGS